MKMNLIKKLGFTLMEVNLAVFIMASGVLAMVSLYPLAYRENQQSVDDVRAAAYADAVFNRVAATLSARNLSWSDWESSVQSAVTVTQANVNQEGGAWAQLCDSGRGYVPKKTGELNSISKRVFSSLTKKASSSGSDARWPVDSNLATALVAQWGIVKKNRNQYVEDHSRVVLSMRVSRNAGSLFAQPIFLTEIHFQGDQLEQETKK